MSVTRLDRYDNAWYSPGKNFGIRTVWYFVNLLIIRNRFFPINRLKIFTLRIFGAKIGKKVVIKPGVNIKYPWLLSVGDFSWIGEDVWIDNLAQTDIGAHCCLSQGAMLLCGNHHYGRSTFDLMVAPITLEDGVWIGAKAVVTPGCRCA